jgi:hypothetical protein
VTLRESLAAELAAPGPQPPGARRTRQAAPKGFEPGVRYDGGIPVEVTTDAIAHLSTEDEWRAAVESMGIVLPDGWRLVLVEARFDPAAWTRENQGEDAVTRPVWRYRFRVEQLLEHGGAEDLAAIVGRWKPRKRPEPAPADLPAFVVAPGDLQLGKIDGDGVEGTIDRFLTGVDRAAARYRALRRAGTVGGQVYLTLLGDCVEGFNSQNGSNTWRTTLTLTEQVRIYRRLVLAAVKALHDVADSLVVATIPGNHGEAVRLAGKMATRYDDSFDIDGVAAVAEACAESERLRDVAFVFPQTDELTITLDIAGTTVALAHGHQFGRDPMKWWAGQAHGMQAPGDATLLLAGHKHFLKVEQSGSKSFVQVPALDGGSTWWRHRTGEDAPPGLVTLAVGGGGWSALEVL